MKISGILTEWFETGLEGAVWVLQEDGKDGYDGLNVLKQGDHLTILSPNGELLWSGTIDCDREIGKTPRPTNPKLMQQLGLGCWIHWVQRGFEPDEWARFFMHPDNDRCRGILVKTSVSNDLMRE